MCQIPALYADCTKISALIEDQQGQLICNLQIHENTGLVELPDLSGMPGMAGAP
jgi:hypothetical protein